MATTSATASATTATTAPHRPQQHAQSQSHSHSQSQSPTQHHQSTLSDYIMKNYRRLLVCVVPPPSSPSSSPVSSSPSSSSSSSSTSSEERQREHEHEHRHGHGHGHERERDHHEHQPHQSQHRNMKSLPSSPSSSPVVKQHDMFNDEHENERRNPNRRRKSIHRSWRTLSRRRTGSVSAYAPSEFQRVGNANLSAHHIATPDDEDGGDEPLSCGLSRSHNGPRSSGDFVVMGCMQV